MLFDAGRATARIIPAYAGSTHRGERVVLQLGDHPRIRGEHISSSCLAVAPIGSSPHTRGALRGYRGP